VERIVAPHLNTVFLVDEWDDRRIATRWFLTNLGCAVDAARSGAEALLVFDPDIHDVVVIGDSRPGLSGNELAHIIKLRSPSTPVIMYAAQAPGDGACADVAFPSPPHLLALKEAVESLIAGLRPAAR
jgi:DNA-binding NtrC family response regulator